jgi:hypothetical protein
MSDLIMLYAGFCYLFHFGTIIKIWADIDGLSKIMNILMLIFSPLLIPIFLGINFSSKKHM